MTEPPEKNPEPKEGINDPPAVHLQVQIELPDKPSREFAYDFQQPVISIGRDPTNDIQIPLTTVSRRHARIFYELGDYFLEDLSSTHGSTHNDRPLEKGEKRLLRDGDIVSLMAFSITFRTKAVSKFDPIPGEKTEQLTRRMVEEVLASLGTDEENNPSLRIMTGPDEGRRFELREDQSEVVIGRSPDCELPLRDHNVSRKHCLIKRDWHGYGAQDLGSRNGVLINDKAIEGLKLMRDGDEIQIGDTRIAFLDPASRILEQMGDVGGPTADIAGNIGDQKTVPPESADDANQEAEEEEGLDDDDDFEDSDGGGDAKPQEPEAVAPPPKKRFKIQAEVVLLAAGGIGLLAAIVVVALLMFG